MVLRIAEVGSTAENLGQGPEPAALRLEASGTDVCAGNIFCKMLICKAFRMGIIVKEEKQRRNGCTYHETMEPPHDEGNPFTIPQSRDLPLFAISSVLVPNAMDYF